MPDHKIRHLSFDRRDLMKLGAGVVMTTVAASRSSGQTLDPIRQPGELRPHTRPGYINDYDRLGGNGPMDDTTRTIVSFVREFGESNLTDQVIHSVNRTMVDSMAALVSGFEGEACRVGARLARLSPPGELNSTVLGYGISTTPELAAFANGCLVRNTDFNDNAPGGHNSDLIPAALAIGEALHSSGLEVMTAVTIGYEIKAARAAGGESVAAAMAAGKLMGLDEDRLANAVGIALIPHVALNKGVGALSMWKGVRTAEATKCGVWAALMAREGMTGPPQPFEGRGSLWSRNGRQEVTLPVQPQLGIQRSWNKTFPGDAQSQGCLKLILEMRAWTTADEIESIQYNLTYSNWQEVGAAPKWDPRNRETADHSMPYLLARALIDGDIYLDSFVPEKYPFRDPQVKALMDKMTFSPVAGWSGLGTARITIRKSNGEVRSWDTLGGVRNPELEDYPLLSDEDIANKFNRACDFHGVAPAQRDRARDVWGNLRDVADIGEAIETLARFGDPRPL